MDKLIRFAVSIIIPAFIMAGGVANSAVAQDKGKAAPAAKAEKGKATIKVLVDNDKFRVWESHSRPGDVNTEDRSRFRVNRTLQGGTLERTYADGRKETLELKTGTVRYLEPPKSAAENYTVKNIGKTTVVQYIVAIKQ